ncbi:hypothetical protein E7T09_17895 [Deinococcus sp. KSM4-11]|uniref:hypothetical protein n=1 Tax=Deinococcus sp. KSM4-11 TaxID=2568654 RepID=UPI0010A595F1|nr:hypothetical protein [Deinococcus sp. KSM4-11]THF84931.1 hypothetical protein E7T09_17895 [Deinococcus sp. KSM4-11]
MTSSGLGRHASKPILEWDEVEMDDDHQDVAPPAIEATQQYAQQTTSTLSKDKGASPWSAMRKLFKR